MSSEEQDAKPVKHTPSCGVCAEARLLLEGYGEAVKTAAELYDAQFRAIVEGDGGAYRFDLLIHDAIENKLEAKYAYLSHVHRHGCSTTHDEQTDARRTRTDC